MISGVTMRINIDEYLMNALKEDITQEDVSTNAVMPEPKQGEVNLICKQDGVICGLEVFERVFKLLDETVVFETELKDGDKVTKGQLMGVVKGDIRALLSGERVALNYLQRMSGIATMTSELSKMAVALTYVFTAFVNVRLPIAANGGLIHLGNVPLFIMAILFGKKTGAIAGGVGMGLFDLLSGWTAWAPFTFIIVGIMGYVVGAMTEKHDQYGWKVAAIFAAFVIKIVGYYIAEIILYGNFIAPISSVPGNVVQIAVAAVVVLIVIEPIEIAVKKIGITQFA